MSNIVNINSIAVLVMFMLTLVSPGDRNLSASALEPENSTSGNVSVDHFPIENDLSTEEEEEESLPAATVGTQEADSFVEDEDQTSKNNSELNASVWTASSNHEVSAKLATDGPSTICPNIRGTNKERTVVKCICQGMEVYVNGKCEPHEGVIIPVQHNVYYSKLESISEFDVIIQDVQCDPDLYLAMNFTQNQFQLRPRGDIVLLKEAGNLEEQRISKYCLIHHLDSQGYLTSTVKTCVPIPYVPRCCSYGYAMKDGVCQSAKTPEKFKPPIVLKPHSAEGVEGLEIRTYINSLTCKYEPMRRIPLGYNGSHLLSLATNGLSLSWKPNEPRVFETFLFCPQYCIDGIEHSDGRVEYFASLCYMTNREFHEKACEKMPCIRKCCELGNSYDTKEEKCVLDSKSTFSLADITNSSRYYILPGYPLCEFFSEAGEEFVIDSDGQLTLNERRYPSTDYCVDITVNTTNRTPSAFVCGNPLSRG
ncbi:uncharacterized protein [Macrobrachium rosenbergii]|uniref:uncharacterized protein n=1 Tax=Macrobrachium rosenbergii TaxID=79674 RepID=UPI0034D5E856